MDQDHKHMGETGLDANIGCKPPEMVDRSTHAKPREEGDVDYYYSRAMAVVETPE